MNHYIYAGLSSTIQNKYKRSLIPSFPELIIENICAKLGIEREDLNSASRKRKHVIARQIAMYIIHDRTDLSLSKIGNMFGGRHHATVIYSKNQYENLYGFDKYFTEMADLVLNNL